MFNERTTLQRLLLLKALSGGGQSLVERTALGNPLTFQTDLASPLKSLLIPFTPVQSGTGDPSPSNIRPIVPWDGMTVKHGGKNLFDVSVMSTRTGVTVEGNTFVGSPYNFRGNGGTIPLKIPKGAKITLSLTASIEASTDGSGFAILFDYSDGTTARPFYTRNSEVEPTYHYGTITAEKDVVGYEFAYYRHSDATWTVKDVQIEIGETATAYEPYKPITETDIVFPSTVYGGEHEAVSGRLASEWAEIAIYNGETIPGEWLSDRDVYQAGTTPTIGAQVVYKLATPQEQTLTGQHINSLVGDNTIWSDADGSMTAVYLVSSKYAEDHPVGGLGSGLLGSGTEDNPEDPADDPIEDPEEEIPDNTEEGSESDD